MEYFKDVAVKKTANIYFDGNVTSRTVEFRDGTLKSLGIMLPGEYRFNTASAELMEFYVGEFEVKFAESTHFESMSAPCSFEVDVNSYFDIKAKSVLDYCCSYI
ncbi:MAG: pyrimidine/purine nucleoside phosphorylase [Sulfurimonadaceae bacterium]|jgi:uncharacterized protein YaiE (UPF0345 family)|nr:pyrimidine/purine nucleoside phosphorylase [Sulfurimonadaceae bacterium]